MGVKAKRAMDSGALVDDEIVTGIVADNLKSVKCSKGFILDGFPRNLVQAEKVRTMGRDERARERERIYIERVTDSQIDREERVTGTTVNETELQSATESGESILMGSISISHSVNISDPPYSSTVFLHRCFCFLPQSPIQPSS